MLLSWFVMLWAKTIHSFFKHTITWPKLKKFAGGSSNLAPLWYKTSRFSASSDKNWPKGNLWTQLIKKNPKPNTVALAQNVWGQEKQLEPLEWIRGINFVSSGRGQTFYSSPHRLLHSIQHHCSIQCCRWQEFRINSQKCWCLKWWEPTILPTDTS